MPEYSSTTITPSDGVQVPGQNGSTSGNFLLSALKAYILSEKGLANGLASLDGNGKLLSSQLPDLADDVIVVDSYATLPATGTAGKIYITADENKMYRWDPDLTTPDYVELSVDLSAYATKAELAEEESARESADSNLNDALTAIDHRLENIEQSKGDYIVASYKDGSVTPSGKGKWCVVEGVEGMSRAWNNIVNPANNKPSVVGAGEIDGITITYNPSTEKYHVSGTASGDYDRSFMDSLIPTNDHKYLIYSNEIPTGTSGNIRLYAYGTGVFGGLFNGTIAKANSSADANAYLFIANGTSVDFDFQFVLRDMSVILSDWASADIITANIPQMVNQLPDILTYDAYGTRIVDWTGNGVRAEGVNLFDKTTATHNVSLASDGTLQTASSGWVSDYIPVKALTDYYYTNVYSSGTRLTMAYYTSDKTFISTAGVYNDTSVASGTKTTPSNTAFVRISIPEAYIDSAMINKGTTGASYHPYMESTLSFPSTTLKSAGSVREKYLLESGEITHPIGQVDMATMAWSYNSTYDCYTCTLSDYSGTDGAYICANYANGGARTIENMASAPKGIYNWGKRLQVKDSASPTGILYFALATPDPDTYSDPILDNTLLTESGGRLSTVQTGTVVDGIADLGFITL